MLCPLSPTRRVPDSSSTQHEWKGAVFAPLAMGGAAGLRAGGPPAERLARWLEGMETASMTAMRHLDDIEAWSARAETKITCSRARHRQLCAPR